MATSPRGVVPLEGEVLVALVVGVLVVVEQEAVGRTLLKI